NVAKKLGTRNRDRGPRTTGWCTRRACAVGLNVARDLSHERARVRTDEQREARQQRDMLPGLGPLEGPAVWDLHGAAPDVVYRTGMRVSMGRWSRLDGRLRDERLGRRSGRRGRIPLELGGGQGREPPPNGGEAELLVPCERLDCEEPEQVL